MAKADVEIKIGVEDKASAKLKNIGTNMQRMGATFRRVGFGMLAVSGMIVGGLFMMAKKTAEAGDEIAKMAKRTGFAVETLSELKHVAEISGTELGSIEKATKRMSKAISDAGDGLATYTRAFDKLGLNIREIQAMSPEEQFWAISSAMADLEDHTLKVALAQDIFGRAGTQLLPMLEEGAEGIAALRQEAHDLGVVFDEEAAKEAEEFMDALTNLETSLQGVGKELIETLMPHITAFAERAVEVIKGIKEWISENEGLVKTLVAVGLVLGVGGAILVGFGMIAGAIVKINAALVLFHALSGPAGWIKLAAGLAIAGGAIFGMTQLLKGMGEGPAPEIPSMQHGGRVPGPIGAPVPIIAHGGEEFAGVGKTFGGTNIHVHIGSFMGDESSLRAFSRKVKQIIEQDNRRTSFAGVNRLGYHAGSSSL